MSIDRCPLCTAPARRERWQERAETFVRCDAGHSLIIAHGMISQLEQARAGKGELAGRLEALSRAAFSGHISNITTNQQVLADLDAFLRDEAI